MVTKMLIDHFRIDLYVYKLPLLSLKNYSDVNVGINWEHI